MVSVIIVTAGIKNYAQDCIKSLTAQTDRNFETIVIDNSLNPALQTTLTAVYPWIRVFIQPRNTLYCRAMNTGIKQSRGEFVLCLNDDVSLEKNFIANALKGFSVSGRVGMVSGKILRRDKVVIDSAGLFLTPWRTAKERGYGTPDRGQFQKQGYVFGVNGAAAFYRREMLEQIRDGADYFDPVFNIFYEDLDIAWRAGRRGWRAYYVPDAIGYHLRGGTVRTASGIGKPYARIYLNEKRQFDLLKNRYLCMIRNEGFLSFFVHLPLVVIYDIFIWGYMIIFRPRLALKFFADLSWLKAAFKKRMIAGL